MLTLFTYGIFFLMLKMWKFTHILYKRSKHKLAHWNEQIKPMSTTWIPSNISPFHSNKLPFLSWRGCLVAQSPRRCNVLAKKDATKSSQASHSTDSGRDENEQQHCLCLLFCVQSHATTKLFFSAQRQLVVIPWSSGPRRTKHLTSIFWKRSLKTEIHLIN